MNDDPRSKPVPAAWRALITSWKEDLGVAGRSPATIRTRADHIQRAARALGAAPADLDEAGLRGWLGNVSWAGETRRSMYASLRSFLRHAGREDLAGALPRVKAAPPAPRPAPDDALAIALRGADARTSLILRLAAEAGLRRGEIAQVHWRDLQRDLLGWSLLVHGKGGRERVVPLSEDLASAVRLWAAGGWLVPGAVDGHLSARRVGELAVEVLPDGWTLHTLRHRFATRAHHATRDILAVSRLLGHASVATTQRYVATDDAWLRAVAVAAA